MAKSSIHIEAGKAGYVYHNSRETPTKNSIFSDEENEVSNSAKDAFKIYRAELKKRVQAYTKKTGRNLHKKTITHLSAIVNLNVNHTLDDLQPLVNHLEKELGTKVFQVAIHRDEGHIEDGKPVKNYHAHIEFMGLDEQGNSVRRKLTKKFLSELQTKTAELLKMERGTNYAKEKKHRPKRLDTYEYKEHKKREEKARKNELAKLKDLKAEMARLRAELKEQGAIREDYARLEALNRELREKIKAKELTIDELREALEEQSEKLNTADEIIDIMKKSAKKLTPDATSWDEFVDTVNRDKEELIIARKKLKEQEETISSKNKEIERLRAIIEQKESELRTYRDRDRQLKRRELNLLRIELKQAMREAEENGGIIIVHNADDPIIDSDFGIELSEEQEAELLPPELYKALDNTATPQSSQNEQLAEEPVSQEEPEPAPSYYYNPGF